MSGKYIIGGVAAAGVGYYLYDQRRLQQELHQPKSWTATKYNQVKGDTVGAKIDSNLSSLQKNADAKTEQTKDWASEKSEDLKKWGDEKSKAASNWATEKQKESESYWKENGKPALKQKYEESKEYLDKKIDQANRNSGGSSGHLNNEDATYNDPNRSVLLKAGDAYIDTVNHAAFAVHDGLYSIKDSIFGTKSDVERKASQAKADASSWVGNKKEETKKSWFNFNNEDKEKSAVSDVARGFGENTSFWAREQEEQAKAANSLAAAKDGIVGGVNKATESTKSTFGSAKDILDTKSKEASQQVNDASEKAKPWFGLKTVDQRDEEKLDKLIAEVSRGYGESATFFAKESYDDIADKPVLIQELREKAQKNLEDAKANLDKHRTHWWSWASKKNKEAEKTAREQWENAQVFSSDVEKKLVEGNNKFKEWTDAAISGTKQGLNYANEKTQEGLTGAQNWIKKDK